MSIWSAAGIFEKNKLANDKPFLIFVELIVKGIAEPIRLVRDNADQTWQGQLWQRFPIDFDQLKDNGSEIPSVALKVSNVGGIVQSYVQQYNGFADAAVKIAIAHAAHLDNPIPEIEVDFVITKTSYTEEWITFQIGASGDQKFRFPFWRYMTNFCSYHFKDIQCGYNGTLAECDGTLTTCRIPKRFGGEPGIPTGT
ncbi:lambda family phage minor tail protein L [Sporomusaceae bacterium BoRhaA]|uniref:DUF1833 family protein n=1 Tax=Pelorhabdus rhamnosifermentans TaxID=2772457 RepID=UPI001C0606D5|nr:DUF1833 family protein [Pelorhabdus rhamnosifermentans]MBU2703871.1 lambda family phage minor tail protein L [Pelorhabdus rhamnosifermentans]